MSTITFDATLRTDKLESSIAHSKKTVKDWADDVEKSGRRMDKSFDKMGLSLKESVNYQKEYIKGLTAEIENMQRAYDNMEAGRKKIGKGGLGEELGQAKRRLTEANKELADYERELAQASKETDNLNTSIGKWALSLGGIAAAFSVLKKALLETTAGINAFNIASEITSQILYNIISGSVSLTAGLKEVIAAQRELNDLRLEEKITERAALDQKILYNKYSVQAHDQTRTATDRIEDYNKAIEANNKMIDIQVAHIQKQIDATEKKIDKRPTEKLLMQWADLNLKIKELEASREAKLKEMTSMQSGLIKQGIDDELNQRTELTNKIKELNNEVIIGRLKGIDKELASLKIKYDKDIETYKDSEQIKMALGEKYAQDRFEIEMKYLDKVKDENTKLVNTLLKLDPGKGYSLLNRSLGGKGVNINKMGSLVGTNQTEAGIAKQREINLKKEKETREDILVNAIAFTEELATQHNLTQEQSEAVGSLLTIVSQLAQGNLIGAAFGVLAKVLGVFGQMGDVMSEPKWKKQIDAWDALIERQQRVIELSERTGGGEKALRDAIDLAQKEFDTINEAIIRERERRGTVPQDLLDARREAMNNLQDAQQALTEFLTGGVNQIDIAGIIADGFEEGKKSAKDFTDDFNDLMRNAINNALEDLSKPSITAWYSKFAADMESAGGLSAEEIVALKKEWDAIVEAEKTRREQIYTIAGITDRAIVNEGLTGQIRRDITEETGTELAGLFRRFADDQRVAKDYSIQGVNHLVGIEANTAETVNQLQLAITELQAINTNTKQVAVGAL